MLESKELTEEKDQEKVRDSISQDTHEPSSSHEGNGVLDAKEHESDYEKKPVTTTQPKVPPPPNGGYGMYINQTMCCS